MSKIAMQRIELLALKKERKPLLETLQRLGVIEITDITQESEAFAVQDFTATEERLKNKKQSAMTALEILNQYAPEKKSMFAFLEGKKEADVAAYDAFAKKRKAVYYDVQTILKLSKEIAESKAEIVKLTQSMDALEPWAALDIPLNFEGTKSTCGFIGSLPGAWDVERLMETFGGDMAFDAEILSTLADQTFLFVLCTRHDGEVLYERLRAQGFTKPAGISKRTPAKQQEVYREKIAALEAKIVSQTKEIEAKAEKREDIAFYADYERMREEKYGVISRLSQSAHTFVLTGYIPATVSEAVKTQLEETFTVGILLSEPDPKEDVPVLLKNNAFSAPLEGVTEGFSLPGKGEIDPTFVMSLFYYILFGIMFSDAGYGLIMTIACGVILLKFKNMEPSMKSFINMFFFCGIATTFWGLMFGSFFGDAIDVIALNFFGKEITFTPLWFSPNDEPMRMLVFSMILGLIHLFTGLGLKMYQSAKNHDVLGGIYDAVLWIVLLGACVILLMTMEMFMNIVGVDFTLGEPFGTIAAVVAVIAAIGIILTGGRESKNPAKRLMKGAYSLYGITSYLSDVLSYSRLLALGLATGVIGTVINKMGAMAGSGIAKVIIFVLVFVVGHLLNFAINALGAYVHANRLQYVEFFGKFYEGGGKKFDPFKENTTYYKIKGGKS